MANKTYKRKREATEEAEAKKTKKIKIPSLDWHEVGGRDGATSLTMLTKFEPGKRYAHTAANDYQLTMVSLQPDDKKPPNCACSQIIKGNKKFLENDDRVVLIVEHDLKEYILCILDNKRLKQCKLDLKIHSGEQIAFRTIGKIPIQLIGKSSKAY